MPTISLHEFDEIYDYFVEGYSVSYDEAYRRFESISMAPPIGLPTDPFSKEYADRYMDVYKQISTRKTYDVQNERALFNPIEKYLRPFPYYTNSLKLAGRHYGLIGQLFEMMDCQEHSDILEFGFGWGHTTLSLAMLGHRVTAVDIEPNFCRLVEKRAELMKVDVEVINADFMWVKSTERQFDAVVFFECFHHCWEFQELLRALHRVLKPGGKLFFGAEPINREFSVPWGIRLDGESLLVARTHGWMELGFHEDFFLELLKRTGWHGERVATHFWRAHSALEPMQTIVLHGNDQRLRSSFGLREGTSLVVDNDDTNAAYAIFGPYIKLFDGDYQVVVHLEEGAASPEGTYIDVVAENGSLLLGGRPVTPAEVAAGQVRHAFHLDRTTTDIEIRLLVPGGFRARVARVVIDERRAGQATPAM